MSSYNSSQNQTSIYALTNGDSFTGYALCYRLLQHHQQQQNRNVELRVLVRSREGYGMSKLEEMGAKIMEINYDDENKVREALKGVKCMTLIPEKTDNRLKAAQNVIQAARHQGVQRIDMISITGVDRIHKKADQTRHHELKNMKEYYEIEKLLQKEFEDKHFIIRCAIFYQFMYYMAPQMESKNILLSPVKKDVKWVLVNINDCVEAIFKLYMKQNESSTGKRVWNFVGMNPMETEKMAKEIGEGLGQRELKLQHVSEEEMMKELKKIKDDKRFEQRPDETEFRRDRDGYWSFPISKFLTENTMKMMMEYWEMANMGLLEISDDDLKKVLGEEPLNLRSYFEKNRNQFSRFK